MYQIHFKKGAVSFIVNIVERGSDLLKQVITGVYVQAMTCLRCTLFYLKKSVKNDMGMPAKPQSVSFLISFVVVRLSGK